MHQSIILIRRNGTRPPRSLSSRSMRTLRIAVVGCLVCFALAAPGALLAQGSFGTPSKDPPREDRYVYHKIPDIPIRTRKGPQHLASLWSDKPLLLSMIFARCGGVCSPFLRSLNSAIADTGGLGVHYRVVVLSFDPRDDVSDLEMIAQEFGVKANENWIFAVASPADIARVAAATGFWFQWDPARQEYDHSSLVVAVDQGKLVRMLAGTTVPSASLRETVQELRGKFVESYALPGKVAFRCFEYDPASGRYTFDSGLALMLLPAFVALLATAWVFLFAPSKQMRNLRYRKDPPLTSSSRELPDGRCLWESTNAAPRPR